MQGRISKKALYWVWIVIFVMLAWRVWILLLPFMATIIMSLIFGLLLYPVYHWVRKRIKKKSLAAFIVIISTILVIFVPLIFIGITLTEQATVLSREIISGDYATTLEANLQNIGITADLELELARLVNRVQALIADNLASILSAVTNMLISLFIIFFLMYYLFTRGRQVIRFLKTYLPLKDTKKQAFLKETKSLVRAVVYGLGLTALIQGTLGGIGFLIFGVPGALFWGFIMVILSLIPLLGSWLVWVPAALFLIVEGSIGQGVGLALYGLIVISQSDNFIRPKVTSKLGNVHPVVVILGVIAGIAWNGFVGVITGPILLGLFIILFKYFVDDTSKFQVVDESKKKV